MPKNFEIVEPISNIQSLDGGNIVGRKSFDGGNIIGRRNLDDDNIIGRRNMNIHSI